MLKKISIKYFFILIIFRFTSLNSNIDSLNPEELIKNILGFAGLTPNIVSSESEESKKLREESEKLIKELEPEIKSTLNKLEEDQKNSFIAIEDKLKNQKSILFSFFRLTAYKEDTVKLAFFGLDYLGKYLIYKKICDKKLDNIFNLIKKDSNELEKLLEDSVKAKPEIVENKLILTEENIKLRKYLCSSFNFNLDILKFAILDNLKSYILDYVENKVLIKNVYQNRFKLNLTDFQALKLSFLYIPFFRIPISYLIMWLLNPSYLVKKSIYDLDFNFELFLNKYFPNYIGFKIPDFFFYKSTKILISIIETMLTIKCINNLLSNSFSNYGLANQEEFLSLIKDYKAAKKSTDREKIRELEIKIKNFITKCQCSIRFDIFNQIKKLFEQKINFTIQLPLLINFIVAYAKLIKNIN